jgi:hypothetical protein
MGKKTGTLLLVLLLIGACCLSMAPAVAGMLPDTGQTKCYNNSGEIVCPAPGVAFSGQDANYTINTPSYNKLDASGNALPDSAASWATVRDNVTGLIWENKTSDGSIHDGSKTFTWCDRNPATNGGNQGTCGTGTGDGATDTEAFIKALNDARFGGFPDWRLPTAKELTTMLDLGRINPAVNTAWFPNTASFYYWTSTNFAEYNGGAWSVFTTVGGLYFGNKAAAAYAVRAVRGGQ